MKPQLVLLGGPNGAGKSTFYDVFLRELHLPFLNADVFEARTGVPSLEAARILDAMRDLMIEQGAGFITETVFSDPVDAKLGMLRKAVDAGYDVTLIYIAIEPSLSMLRVDQRARPAVTTCRAIALRNGSFGSLENLRAALLFVPRIKLYDNSSTDEPYRLLAVFENGKRTLKARSLPEWARRILRPARRPARRAR